MTWRSGTSIRGDHRSRKGHKILKRALFPSAFAGLEDPPPRAYYDRKRIEGNATTMPSLPWPADAATLSAQCAEAAPSTTPVYPQPPDENHRGTPGRKSTAIREEPTNFKDGVIQTKTSVDRGVSMRIDRSRSWHHSTLHIPRGWCSSAGSLQLRWTLPIKDTGGQYGENQQKTPCPK